jgi:hypothetical protein
MRVVEDMIKRIMAKVNFARLSSDDVCTIWARNLAEIGECIWPWHEEEGEDFLEESEKGPGWREEQNY